MSDELNEHATLHTRGTRSLIEILVNEELSTDEREEAATALGHSNDTTSLNPLIDVMGNRENDVSLRITAAYALGNLGDIGALQLLTEALLDVKNAVKVRIAAAGALGTLGDSRCMRTLVKISHDTANYDPLRTSSMRALATLGHTGCIRQLVSLLADENLTVAQAAQDTLEEIVRNNTSRVSEDNLQLLVQLESTDEVDTATLKTLAYNEITRRLGSVLVAIRCECGKRYRVQAKFAGRKTKCLQCGNRLAVPELEFGSSHG